MNLRQCYVFVIIYVAPKPLSLMFVKNDLRVNDNIISYSIYALFALRKPLI